MLVTGNTVRRVLFLLREEATKVIATSNSSSSSASGAVRAVNAEASSAAAVAPAAAAAPVVPGSGAAADAATAASAAAAAAVHDTSAAAVSSALSAIAEAVAEDQRRHAAISAGFPSPTGLRLGEDVRIGSTTVAQTRASPHAGLDPGITLGKRPRATSLYGLSKPGLPAAAAAVGEEAVRTSAILALPYTKAQSAVVDAVAELLVEIDCTATSLAAYAADVFGPPVPRDRLPAVVPPLPSAGSAASSAGGGGAGAGKGAAAAAAAEAFPSVEWGQSSDTVLTHGYSATVAAWLLSAGQKRRLQVLVADAAPSHAGRRMVQALTTEAVEAGHRPLAVALISDASVWSLLPRCTRVVLGAVAVTRTGGALTAVGALPLATAALVQQVPLVIVTSSLKLCAAADASELGVGIGEGAVGGAGAGGSGSGSTGIGPQLGDAQLVLPYGKQQAMPSVSFVVPAALTFEFLTDLLFCCSAPSSAHCAVARSGTSLRLPTARDHLHRHHQWWCSYSRACVAAG